MPESIDSFHPGDPIEWLPSHPAPKRRGFLFLIVAILAVLFFGSRTILSYYVSSLWFDSLGYSAVFFRTLGIQWTVFAIFFALTFGLLFGWFLALRRAYQHDLPLDRVIFINGHPLQAACRRHPARDRHRHLALIISVVTGASMMGEWATFALWLQRAGCVRPGC